MDFRTPLCTTLRCAALAALVTAAACGASTAGADAAQDLPLADQGPHPDGGLDRPSTHPDSAPGDLPLVDALPVDAPAVDAPRQDGPPPRPDLAQRPDLAGPEASVKDTGPALDGLPSFPTVLGGIWLMGYASGGSNHFSWVKFTVSSSSGGSAVLLDGRGLTKNTPYWNCSGSTSWNTSSARSSIQLNFPSSACNGYRSSVYTFIKFYAAGSYPTGATLQADVTDTVGSVKSIKAYKFPSSQCNAAMSSCTDPL